MQTHLVRRVRVVAREGMLLRARLAPLGPTTASIPQVIARDTLVRSGYDLPVFRGHPNYDVMPDGRLILFGPVEDAQRLVVAHGWLAALRSEWAKEARK